MSMNKLRYGSFFGLETLTREYKEISFQHISIPFSEEKIDEYLKTFKWDFNSLVMRSIKNYIKFYLPKYICGFLDKRSDHTEDAHLYFGVGDDGIITGIPMQLENEENEEENRKELKKMIWETLDRLDSLDSLDTFDKLNDENDWKKYIDIDILPLDYKKNEDLPEYFTFLDEYNQKRKIFQQKLENHKKKYMRWKMQNDLYSRKLTDLYNDPYTKTKFVRYLRLNRQNDILDKINNGYQMEQKSYEEIRIYRQSYTKNVYSLMCEWKDKMMDKIRKKKPLREKAYRNVLVHSEPIYGPMHFFIKMRDIVPWWMQYNKNMKLFVIRFTFKKPEKGLDICMKSGVRYYRTINTEKQPCCVPYQL